MELKDDCNLTLKLTKVEDVENKTDFNRTEIELTNKRLQQKET